MRVVIIDIVLVETVKQRQLFGVEQRHVLQRCCGIADESIGSIADGLCQTFHQLVAVTSIVVLQADARLTRLVVHDEEGDAELRRVRLEGLNGYRLTFILIVIDDAHLVGEHDFCGEVVVGRDACKRISLVLQRFFEVLAGFVDELHDTLLTNGGTQCQRIDEHTHGVADTQVRTSVTDGGDAQLLVVGKA